MLNLAGWLIVSVLVFTGALLAALTTRRPGGSLTGLVLALAADVLALAALMRFAVLPAAAVVLLLLVLVVNTIQILVAKIMAAAEDAS